MFVPEKNKLNKFKLVVIPKAVEYFARYGFQSPSAEMYTGDDVAVTGSRKVDTLADMDMYDRYMQEQENLKSNE